MTELSSSGIQSSFGSEMGSDDGVGVIEQPLVTGFALELGLDHAERVDSFPSGADIAGRRGSVRRRGGISLDEFTGEEVARPFGVVKRGIFRGVGTCRGIYCVDRSWRRRGAGYILALRAFFRPALVHLQLQSWSVLNALGSVRFSSDDPLPLGKSSSLTISV